MSNVINLKNVREKHIKEVEEKVWEEYGVVKLGEDSYIVPSNVAETKEISTDFMNSDFHNDEALKKAIAQLEVSNGDYISVSCKAILGANEKVLEVANISNEEIIDVTVNSTLDYEQREMLVNMMAYIHKDKELKVTFYLHYNFELIEQLVEK